MLTFSENLMDKAIRLDPKCPPDPCLMGTPYDGRQPQNRQSELEKYVLGSHSHDQGPPRKRRRLHGKVVKISSEDQIREHHYTDDEVRNTWYSQCDYKRFINECRGVIRKADESRGHLQKLSTCHDDTTCIRGLEDQLVPRINRLKQKQKKGLIDMVVRQQVIHKLTGTFDACRIRSISMIFSHDSKKWAMELAANDEAFVRQTTASR